MLVKNIFYRGTEIAVREDGRIFTCPRDILKQRGVWHLKQRELKQRKDRDGYLRVRFNIEGKRTFVMVHRLVATAFIPNPDHLPQINHKDEVKTNNSVSNLEWCDTEYNNHYGTGYERRSVNHGKKIQMLKGNEVIMTFNSIREASIFVNGSSSNIGNVCNGRLKKAYGFNWRFLDNR